YILGRRDGILDRGREFVLGREAIVDGYQPAAGCLRQRSGDTVVGLDAACNEAAAVKKDEAWRRFARGRCRRIEPIGDVASRPRQGAVFSCYLSAVGTGKLHQLSKRPAAL